MANKTLTEMVNFLLAGSTEAALVQELGISQPTVNAMKNGRPTWYETGKKIEVLYESRKRKRK